MPAKQPFRSKRLIEVPRRIEHHFDNAFDTAVHDVDAGHVHAQTARDRRADLRRVELLPFDFAALDRLFRQSLEGGLLLKREPERLHAPNESSLLMTDGGQHARRTAAGAITACARGHALSGIDDASRATLAARPAIGPGAALESADWPSSGASAVRRVNRDACSDGSGPGVDRQTWGINGWRTRAAYLWNVRERCARCSLPRQRNDNHARWCSSMAG